ncbi:hypothetical protein MNBD_GAMMA23-938 [hydrothermal vent metagenome]|uniref:Filament cap protein n=1 Tax=hydrothermal vent metagenome TaxID=652676 RepID=A0A3B1ABQ4_9ZZZZ
MPTITSVGVGSGIDVQGLVEKLVAAEGDPVTKKLDRKEATLQNSLTALGVFQGALTEFQTSLASLKDAQSFTKMSLTLSDDDVLNASISGDPDPGNFDIEVERLAQQHRLVSGTFASDLEAIGSGSISIQFGELNNVTGDFIVNPERPVKNIFITSDNNSLRGIQGAINDADAGVKASVLRVGKGFRLIVSSELSGATNSMRLKVNDNDNVDTDLSGLSTLSYEPAKLANQGQNLRQTSEGLNAIIKIDGVEIESPKNSINDVISGVTLDLSAESIGQTVGLKIFHDKAQVSSSIEGFVTQYNSFIQRSNELTSYDPETKEAGPLANDSSVRSALSQLRRALGTDFSAVNSQYVSLSALGLDTQRSGEQKIDTNKVQAALDKNITEVSQLFSRTGSANDPLVRYIGATDTTKVGNYPVVIDTLPTQGNYIGLDVAPSNIIIPHDVNTLVLRVDNIKSSVITLNSQVYNSLENLASELQSKINGDRELSSKGAAVNISVEDNHLVLTSQHFGGTSNIEILEIPEQLMAVTGLSVKQGQLGSDIQGAIGGNAAIGSGRTLMGQGNARGLEIEVVGGGIGRRGTVSYSKGVAERLDKLVASFLDAGGLLQGRTKGFTDNLKNILDDRNKLAEKLEKSEKQHLKTFSNLDALVGKMRSTGEYLSRQLAALPGARSQSNRRG